MLTVPGWKAAARPWDSGRPLEIYIDASDTAWCAVLCQRTKAGGTPRPFALVARAFDDAATRWYTFEREFFGFRERVRCTSQVGRWLPYLCVL